MFLVIPYSHTDIDQTLRLVKWLGWLSSLDSDSMKRERILLVPSRHAAERKTHREICALAARIFGEARSFTPNDEHETGWPGACNFMLKAALEHVEQHFQDDVFLLEPDAIPVVPEWFRTIEMEWDAARILGKEFMGAFVDYDIPHMTGIGVYGRNWRAVAPKLAEVQNQRGWDTYAADQILPNAHITDLIQHKWWRNSQMPYSALDLDFIKPTTVVFHQDKEGRLFKMLDDEHWNGRADQAVHYSDPISPETVSMHYFFTHNLNKVHKAQGQRFVFDPLDNIGGTWRGTYATSVEVEVIALKALAANAASGVVELTKEEFEEKTKKKAPISLPSNTSVRVQESLQTGVQIKKSPALLVAEPDANKPSPTEDGTGAVVQDINDVLKLSTVKPVEPPKTVIPAPSKAEQKAAKAAAKEAKKAAKAAKTQ
jgi:hypothetical protein